MEITLKDAEELFKHLPPGYTPKEWEAKRLQALTVGVFDIGEVTYRIKVNAGGTGLKR